MPKKNQQAPEHAQKAKNIKEVAQASSMVVQKPLNALATTFPKAMEQAKEHIGVGLQALTAATAMKDLAPQDVLTLHDYSKGVEDAVGETVKFARARALILKDELGTPMGNGLSKEVKVGNLTKRFIVQKSGLDPKVVEAAIRAKDLSVTKYMDPDTKYILKQNDLTRKMLIDDGVFTADELKTMEYEPQYRVERSKEVTDE